MVSMRKLFFTSVHRAFIIENTFSIDALLPGITKENSKMILFLNEMPAQI
jgi:hypothetical protein